MSRRRALAALVFASAAFALGVGAADAQQAPPRVSFSAEKSLAIKWADLADGPTVEVFNNDTRARRLEFVLTAFREEEGDRRLAEELVVIAPRAARLDPGASVELKLTRAAGADIEAGTTYTASVAAFGRDSAVFARLPLTLTRADVTTGDAKPLTDAVTVSAFDKFLYADWVADKIGHGGWFEKRYPTTDDVLLPLKTKAANVEIEDETELGTIKSGTNVAVASFVAPPQKLASGHRALPLRFDGLDQPGEYEGKLDLLPASEGGDVTLKVVYSDFILLPLLALLGGVLFGWWISQSLGVTLRYRDMRARLGQLDDDVRKKAIPQFNTAAANTGWNETHVVAALEAEEERLKAAVEDLRASYRTKIPDDKANEVIADINVTREKFIAVLPALAGQLKALQSALVEIGDQRVEPSPPDIPYVDRSEKPAIHMELAPLLTPSALTSLKALEDKKAAIEAAAKSATTWRGLEESMSTVQRRIDELEPHVPDSLRDELESAQEDLSNAFDELWRTKDVTAREPQLVRRIDRVWRQLDTIVKRLDDEYVPLDEGERKMTLGFRARPDVAAADVAVEAEIAVAPPIAPGEAKRYAALRDERAWLLVALAFAVAVLTGLNTQYVGKAFGASIWDYVTLFLWGVTTKVALDLVLTSLDSLAMARIPRR